MLSGNVQISGLELARLDGAPTGAEVTRAVTAYLEALPVLDAHERQVLLGVIEKASRVAVVVRFDPDGRAVPIHS